MTFDRQREAVSFTVLAFANHVYRLAPHILDMLDGGQPLEATPLLRLALESAVTAQWLWVVPDAVGAFANEGMRQRKAVAKTLLDTTFESAMQMAAAMTEDLPADVPSSSGPAGRSFERRCSDLAGAGEDVYAVYRLLTQYSHPTMYLSDFYLRLAPEGAGPSMEYDEDSQLETHLMWAHLTCVCLVWAGRAADRADRQEPRLSELRDAAVDLGVPFEFSMSEDARDRVDRHQDAGH